MAKKQTLGEIIAERCATIRKVLKECEPHHYTYIRYPGSEFPIRIIGLSRGKVRCLNSGVLLPATVVTACYNN